MACFQGHFELVKYLCEEGGVDREIRDHVRACMILKCIFLLYLVHI